MYLVGIVLILCTACILRYGAQNFPVTKKDLDCDRYAIDGDCVTNPNFMWSACHSSCMSLAIDTEDDCKVWAAHGECAKDAAYTNLHCPVACGRAIGWSPWIRKAAGITADLPYSEAYENELDSCMNPVDIVGAAEVIASQVVVYLLGGARMTASLASQSPTEYLGLFGLTEAILYSLALYNLNSIFSIDRLNSIPYPTISVLETIESARLRYDRDFNNLQKMNDIINSGYSSDILLTKVPEWQNLLHIASGDANVILSEYAKLFPSHTNFPEAINVSACPVPRGPSILEIIKFMPNLENPHTQIPVYQTMRLSNGIDMPTLALGTWQLPIAECESIVLEAIRIGYRHIDTAEAFRNEFCVGWAMTHAIDYGYVTREELFISTKISDEKSGGYMGLKRLVDLQLEKLKTDYIDLYMLHGPMNGKNKQRDTWRAMEELVKEGKIRSLGVSNFDSKTLKQLMEYATVVPVVLQNKIDVYHVGKQIDRHGDDALSVAAIYSMRVMGYSPLSGYPFVLNPVEDPIVNFIAASKQCSPAQVIIRWLLQHDFGAVVRSSSPEHLEENLAVFHWMEPLTVEEMHLLDTIQFLVESPITRAVPLNPPHIHFELLAISYYGFRTKVTALSLFLVGLTLFLTGAVSYFQRKSKDSSTGLDILILGSIMLLPGSYAVLILLGISLGWRGYNFSHLPSLD